MQLRSVRIPESSVSILQVPMPSSAPCCNRRYSKAWCVDRKNTELMKRPANFAGLFYYADYLPMRELRSKFRLVPWEQNDLKLPFITFRKRWAADLLLSNSGQGVLHFYGAGAAHLNGIVDVSVGGQAVCAKARARIVDFK